MSGSQTSLILRLLLITLLVSLINCQNCVESLKKKCKSNLDDRIKSADNDRERCCAVYRYEKCFYSERNRCGGAAEASKIYPPEEQKKYECSEFDGLGEACNLKGGYIAAIVVGSILLVAILVAIPVIIIIRRRRRGSSRAARADSANEDDELP